MSNIHDSFPTRFLKAEDLKGKKATLTIEEVDFEEIRDKKEQPVLYFKKQKKQLVLNKTNALLIEELLGTAETDEWVNKQITIYSTRVDFQGKRVPAIRVEVPDEVPPEEDDSIGDEADSFA